MMQSAASFPAHQRKPLPADLIVYTIDFLVPCPAIVIAYPASHVITKTLFSLCLASRQTHSVAISLLYAHCMFIDSGDRLQRLLRTLTTEGQRESSSPILRSITSMYLAPFSDDDNNDEELESPLLADSISIILEMVSPTIKKLVIDMPLRQANWLPFPRLTNAFGLLTSLELFCSVRDELFLGWLDDLPPHDSGIPVWTLWPNLKTLALYNPDVSQRRFWQEMKNLSKLETLVLTRADGLLDIEFWEELSAYTQSDVRSKAGVTSPLKVLVINVESQHSVLRGTQSPRNEKDHFIVKKLNVPTSYYGDDDIIELCQAWVKRNILKGKLLEEED